MLPSLIVSFAPPHAPRCQYSLSTDYCTTACKLSYTPIVLFTMCGTVCTARRSDLHYIVLHADGSALLCCPCCTLFKSFYSRPWIDNTPSTFCIVCTAGGSNVFSHPSLYIHFFYGFVCRRCRQYCTICTAPSTNIFHIFTWLHICGGNAMGDIVPKRGPAPKG